MKRFNICVIVAILLFSLLFHSTGLAFSKHIDVSEFKNNEGFYSYNLGQQWSYSAHAYGTGQNGESIDMMIISWGRGYSLTGHPALRFFVKDTDGVSTHLI